MTIGPKYTRSAVDIISPMLSSMAERRNRTENRNAGMLAGLSKGIEASANSHNWNKRGRLINYVGDDKLAEMRNQLNELKGERNLIQKKIDELRSPETGDTFKTNEANNGDSVENQTDLEVI